MMIQKEILTIQPVLRIQLTDKKCTRPTNSKLPYLHMTLQNCQLAAASVSKKSSVDLNVLGLVFMRTYIRTFVALPRGRLRGQVDGESQPRPKPRPITSPDRPGPPLFLRACNIEKSGVAWGRG